MQKCGDFQEPHVCMKSLPTQGRLWYRWRFLVRRSLRWIQIYALIYVNVHNDVIHCGISESHESHLDVSGSIWHAKKSSKDFLCIQVAFLDSAMLWLILRAGNAINQSELRSLAEMLWVKLLVPRQVITHWLYPKMLTVTDRSKDEQNKLSERVCPVVMKFSDFWGKSHEFPEFPGSLC